MKGKTKAALLGVLLGVGIIVFIELIDVWLSDGGFFDTLWSWLLLALLVVVFPFLMVNAYHNRRGMYADRDEPTDNPDGDQERN